MSTITQTIDTKSIIVNGEKTSEASTTKIDVAVNGGVFIVPNGIGNITGAFREDDKREFYSQCRIIDENGTEHEVPTVTDKLVELWFEAVDDLGCDNIVDHGFSIEVNGERRFLRPDSSMSLMPVDIFLGKKEGDTITVRFPLRENFEDSNVTLTMTMRLAQKDYRYRRFGTFEEVLNDLMMKR